MITSKKVPTLSFESFFSTNVTALGFMTFFYPVKKIKDVSILFSGKFINNTLILKEKYQDSDSKVIRIWSFNKISNSYYIGKENNVKGDIKVTVNANQLNMEYNFITAYKQFTFSVRVKDSMYLVDKKTLINKTIVSKYGLPLAESFLVYKKS